MVMRVRPIPATTRRIVIGGEARARGHRRRGTRPVGMRFGPPGSVVRPMDRVSVHFRGAVSLLGRFPALAGVDLDVAEGEVVLVRGPNGAGKTTLLRACAGLLPLSAGTGIVLGHDLAADRHTVRSELALVRHAPGAYDDLTVRETARFR